jgi:serine/threonine protein kinase
MEQIGPYKVIGEIGRGGMGVVLRGLDPAIGRPVAIKVILLQEFSDPKDREMLRARLFREAQAAGILNHPGIVTVYYVGEEGNNAFIAMEYVNGPSLEKLLSAPQPPGKDVLRRVLWQAAAALDYAHSKGIVHRDIKPANIMLDESGTVKICDFGIAKGLAGQTALTQAGTAVGSPFYMSPEQIRGGGLDGRADQYSLGVVAYQALTGQRPFQSEQIQSLFFHIMNEPPPPAYQVNPALSAGVSEVLQKVLAKDAAARFASCSEFVRALLEAWDAEPVPAASPAAAPAPAPTAPLAPVPPPEVETAETAQPTPAPARSGPGAKLWIGGLAAAIVLAGLGIGAFYWTKVRSHQSEVSTPAPSPPPEREPITPPNPEPIPRPPAPVAVAAPALSIENFSVEPQSVAQGQAALLKWSVKHAAEISITPDIGKVGAAGARSVIPQSPTTYELTAKAANGPSKTASVTLGVLARPAIQDFSASRTSIQSGQAAVLKWSVTGAERVSIDQGIGDVPLEGNRPVSPTVSREYVLQATGPGGSVSQPVTITVTYRGNPNIVRFSADPDTIAAGETAVLRWEVVNADEVTIRGVGPVDAHVDAHGPLRVSPRATTTYSMSAASPRGTVRREVKVTVKR